MPFSAGSYSFRYEDATLSAVADIIVSTHEKETVIPLERYRVTSIDISRWENLDR